VGGTFLLMSRHCERPGCSNPASVLYGIVLGEQLVWLEAGDADGPHDAGVLCKRHADALVVPRGWFVDDRRQPIPKLFRDPIGEEPTQRAKSNPAPRRKVVEPEVPSLFDAPIDPEEPEADLPQPALEMSVVTDSDTVDATGEIIWVEPDEDVNEYSYEPLEDDELGLSVDDSKAHPWVPELEKDGDFTKMLSSSNKLLGRAFNVRDDTESFEFDQPDS
jgi:hypothetical protein